MAFIRIQWFKFWKWYLNVCDAQEIPSFGFYKPSDVCVHACVCIEKCHSGTESFMWPVLIMRVWLGLGRVRPDSFSQTHNSRQHTSSEEVEFSFKKRERESHTHTPYTPAPSWSWWAIRCRLCSWSGPGTASSPGAACVWLMSPAPLIGRKELCGC